MTRAISGLFGRGAALLLATGGATLLTGCAVVGFAGAMAESAHEAGTSTIEAEYSGIAGNTYAIVVWADRSVQMKFPALAPSMTQRVDEMMKTEAGATGHLPADDVTQYLANTPQWVVWPRSRLVEELDVDRLIYVEVNEFRTNAPGNTYTWDGLAWATVSVIERDRANSDAEAFRKDIQVRFPDGRGFTQDEISGQGVSSVLLDRLVDRTAWLFYTHEEPNSIKY